jgi:glycosyltransferase involved in cell wall biosynthesis
VKALFILPDLSLGGAERTTLRLMRDLNRRGTEADLFLLRHEGVLLSELPSEIVIRSTGGPNGRIPPKLRRLARLLKYARETDVVVGALELMPTYLAYACGVLLKKPVVGWVHTSMDIHLQNYSHLQRRICAKVYPRLHKVVIVSEAVSDSLLSVARVPTDRIAVINSYLDFKAMETMAAEPPPFWSHEILAGPTIVAVARLSPEKRLDALIKAHARLEAEGLHHNLLILGEGPCRAELERLADHLNVRGSVFLPGYVANPFPIVKAASVFVLPSRYEGFPHVLLEALGVGAAIVATNCPGGSGEILAHGKYGMMVPPEDEDALAESISKLMTDKALAARLRSRGPERARRFTPESSLLAWESLFSELRGA